MNSTPRTARLKQELGTAGSRETALRMWDEFLLTGPTEAEIELGAVYLGWTLYEFET
jgi:hypothetical protein